MVASGAQPAQRQFSAQAVNVPWVCDTSCIRIGEGWLHLAMVIDLYSRRVVGYAVADHMRTN